jgi:hypothetical protein
MATAFAIIGFFAALYLLVAPNSQWNSPADGWARIIGFVLILLAIKWG